MRYEPPAMTSRFQVRATLGIRQISGTKQPVWRPPGARAQPTGYQRPAIESRIEISAALGPILPSGATLQPVWRESGASDPKPQEA